HTARELAESFHLLRLPELFLNVFALDELDDLTAHRREHPQQFVIRGSNLRAEKIDYSESLVPQPDGKRDCAAQTQPGGQYLVRKVGFLRHVPDPCRLSGFPNAAGQTFTRRERRLAADGREFIELRGRRVPDFNASQPFGYSIHRPKLAQVPLELPTSDFQDSLRGFSERSRFGQRLRHGMMCG